MSEPARAKALRDASLRGGRAPWGFLAPYMVLMAIFFVFPFLNAVVLAFYQTNGPLSRVFVGFDNFLHLLTDPVFHRALWNTSVFAFFSVFLQLPLSMLLALLLNSSRGRFVSLFRLLLFSPNLVGQIFVGILFQVLFTPRYGLINQGINELVGWGLEVQWLNNPNLVMPALVLTSLWIWVGFNMIYFLAALQAVDKSQQEAARIDGANSWQVFWNVTLPSMRHVVVFVTTMSIIGSYQLFELPLALFNQSHGFGPDNSALTVITYLNEVAFRSGDLGLGSAIGWVVAGIIFFLSLAQFKLTGTLDEQS